MADDEASAFLLYTAQFVFGKGGEEENKKTILLEKNEFAAQKQQGNSKTTGQHKNNRATQKQQGNTKTTGQHRFTYKTSLFVFVQKGNQ